MTLTKPTLYQKLRETVHLFRHLNHYIDPKLSYYPAGETKSKREIIKDQLGHIWRYGYMSYRYYVMGIDVKGEKWQDYVSERFNLNVLAEVNKEWPKSEWGFNYVLSLADKWSFAEIMENNGFPIPPTVGLLRYGRLMWHHSQGVMVDLEKLLDCEGDLLLKPVLGSGGEGIIPVKIIDHKLYNAGKEISVDELRPRVKDDTYLIQRRVTNQHPQMKAFFDKSLNTIRVTMARTETGIDVLGCMFMTGASDAAYSNWHYGGICVSVDENGRLGKYGFSLSKRRITAHPDSGIPFEGYQLPFFKETIQLCKQAMDVYYGMQSIGWDMAITEDGPIIIEGNNLWGVVAHQMVEHKGWADKYKKYFNQ